MPGTKDARLSERWFADHFGFPEMSREETRNQFAYGGGLLSNKANNKFYQVGTFEELTLGQLQDRFTEECTKASGGYWGAGGLSFRNIVGQSRGLHADKNNAGSVFQVASLFNCLESIPRGSGPETGITAYGTQGTQGAACAMACPGATVYRSYFLNYTEAGEEELDCLKSVATHLQNKKHGYWTMRHGYCLPTGSRSIQKLSADIQSDAPFAEEVRQHVQVGIHWDTEVYTATHNVCQVFCSAPPVGLLKSTTKKNVWQGFASAILDAVFDATLTVAAILAAKRGRRVSCFLTLVGAGDLGCRREWIDDALERALLKHDKEPIDVRLVHYASVPQDGTLLDLENGRGGDDNDEVDEGRRPSLAPSEGSEALALGGPEELGLSRTQTKKMTSAFECFDANGDGVIDRTEFTRMLQFVDKGFFTLGVIEKLLDEADVDNNGYIYYNEFINWLAGEDEDLAATLLAKRW